MLSMNVSALSIIRVGEIEEIPGCDGYTCWYINKTDTKNKTHEETER
jgi:hypothetical protein